MQNCGCVMRKIRLLSETSREKKKRKKKEITVKGVFTGGSTCMPRLYNRRSAGVFSRMRNEGHDVEFRRFENRAREGNGRVLCNSGRVIVISLVAPLVDRIFFPSLGDWPVLGRSTKRGGGRVSRANAAWEAWNGFENEGSEGRRVSTSRNFCPSLYGSWAQLTGSAHVESPRKRWQGFVWLWNSLLAPVERFENMERERERRLVTRWWWQAGRC